MRLSKPHRVAGLLAGLALSSAGLLAGPDDTTLSASQPVPRIESVLALVRRHLSDSPALRRDRILQIEWQPAAASASDTPSVRAGRWRIDLVATEQAGNTGDPARANVIWVEPDGTLTAERIHRSFDP